MVRGNALCSRRWSLVIIVLALCGYCGGPALRAQEVKHLTARSFNSGFELSNGTFNGMLAASDGKIYYVLCAENIDTGGQMFSYDPATDKITHLGDLTEASGEKGMKAVPQGKSHVSFVESNGKLYFATHVDWYSVQNDLESMAPPPPGYKPYPGGHFLAYDMATGKFENFAKAPEGQGIISMNMDTQRGRMYGLTWPSGYFLRYDLKSGELKNLGPLYRDGEGGHPTKRVICRALPIDPRDGSVYFTTADGDILRYRYDRDAIETVQGDNLRKDYLGTWNPLTGQDFGYGWRQAFWYAPENVVYAVHGRSSYLLRFDPQEEHVDVLERLASVPTRRSGMYDEFHYGYLSLSLGPDGHTLYYLEEGGIVENGKRVVKRGPHGDRIEDLHLITYDIPAAKYTDHGAVFFSDSSRPGLVNSIAVGKDGAVYCLTDIPGKQRRADLVRIPPVE